MAGKTGTTQENADGWFIGMSPQLVVGSWTGFDDRRITYPNTRIGQGGRTGLRNVGKFLSLLQTEGDSLIRLDPSLDLERPENYRPPTRRSRIGEAGYWPDDSRRRSRRSRSSSSSSRSGSSEATRQLNQYQNRNSPPPAPRPEPRPQTQGGGSSGRIGW